LDQLLAELDPDLTRSQASLLIRDGHVHVLDVYHREIDRLKAGLKLIGGETVIVEYPDPQPLSAAPENIPLDIRYEDDDLLVINKPAGLVVHPAPGHSGGTLVNALAAHCEQLSSVGGEYRPGIIHRLDKNTSGLLIVAKNNAAHHRLSRQLSERTLRREYLALVWGHPDPPDGRIEAPVGRSYRDGKSMAVGGRANKQAITHYATLEDYPYTSWLSLRLQTGRTHQIRVHMQHIGHPVVGDPDYGGRSTTRGVATGYQHAARRLVESLDRQALHAWRLSFVQPTSGEEITVTSDIPGDMQAARALASGPSLTHGA